MKQLTLTARQYGEVMLPDESTGQSQGTPRQRGRKTVTVQGFLMRAGAGVRVQVTAGSVMGAGFAKTMTSPLIIPSVLACVMFFIYLCQGFVFE